MSGSVTGNVFVGTHPINIITQGAGICIGNVNSAGLNVRGNLFEYQTSAKVAAIELSVGSNDSNGYAARRPQ